MTPRKRSSKVDQCTGQTEDGRRCVRVAGHTGECRALTWKRTRSIRAGKTKKTERIVVRIGQIDIEASDAETFQRLLEQTFSGMRALVERSAERAGFTLPTDADPQCASCGHMQSSHLTGGRCTGAFDSCACGRFNRGG